MTGNGLQIGVDIGGSNARLALVDRDRILAERHLLTGRQRTAAEVSFDVGRAILEMTAEAAAGAVNGVGVGVAGQVEPARGIVRYAPNLDWHDYPLRDALAQQLGIPVAVLNDVQAAAYGEWSYGSAKGASDAVTLFVGTGVGGGMISGGELVRGCSGSAGEFGHIVVQLDGPPCRCGQHGCLEALAGGWAIAVRACAAVTAQPTEGAYLLELVDGVTERIDAGVVARGAASGDPLALQLVNEIGTALGAGLASIANAFNPCVVVLGGGVVEGIPALLSIAETTARARALPPAVRSLRILPAALRGYAGVIGAAAWANSFN